LYQRLHELHIPTLLIAGALDSKFSVIAQQMAHEIPASQLAIVPGAGHTIHLEQPAHFLSLVCAFVFLCFS
jgi:2-succinyl-6-hydroxy-2,4-cyclohexadiene-1-carboxylate synthase